MEFVSSRSWRGGAWKPTNGQGHKFVDDISRSCILLQANSRKPIFHHFQVHLSFFMGGSKGLSQYYSSNARVEEHDLQVDCSPMLDHHHG